MWTCAELKNDAKNALRGKYWMGFLLTLIVIAMGSIGGSLSVFIPFGPIALSFLVLTVLTVGMVRWFSRSREAAATPPVELIFGLFKGDVWGKTVAGMLWMYLFLFLWSLFALVPYLVAIPLFFITFSRTLMQYDHFEDWPSYATDVGTAVAVIVIFSIAIILLSIPAIIKYYSYCMTPWILADNPQIGHERALKLSMNLTRGQKWHIFVLDLSFLGWWILGMLAMGIGMLFVYPYYLATQAELYARLRQEGVRQGLCTMDELGFLPVSPT